MPNCFDQIILRLSIHNFQMYNRKGCSVFSIASQERAYVGVVLPHTALIVCTFLYPYVHVQVDCGAKCKGLIKGSEWLGISDALKSFVHTRQSLDF